MKTVFESLRTRAAGRCQAGSSLPEVLVAMAIGGVALGSTLMMNSHQLRVVKSTREANAASLALEERIEQLRIANWRQITDQNYLINTYYATVPKSAAPLVKWTERITVSPWATDATDVTPLIVEKVKGAPPRVLSQGAGLSSLRLAKMDVTITWNGMSGRDRTRELTTVISNGGISRMNLPAMGAAGGSSTTTATTTTTTTSSTPAPTTTTTTTTSSTPAPTTTTTTTTVTGRGNVGGRPGKK